jgi:hypothetical protein
MPQNVRRRPHGASLLRFFISGSIFSRFKSDCCVLCPGFTTLNLEHSTLNASCGSTLLDEDDAADGEDYTDNPLKSNLLTKNYNA